MPLASDILQPSPLANTVAVILAGGFGTRIKHLLRDLPKPMAPVASRPFVEWVIRYLARQGIRRVVLSTGYLADSVTSHFASQPVHGVRVDCVPETTPLGTAGGFLNAADAVAEKPTNWLVLNGDSIAFADLNVAAAPLAGGRAQGVIVGVEMTDASRYGTVKADANGRLQSFIEKQPGAGVINAGIYFFNHSLLTQFPSQRPLSFEKDVFPKLIASGAALQVHAARAPFLDIGTPESLPQAEEFILQNQAEFKLD